MLGAWLFWYFTTSQSSTACETQLVQGCLPISAVCLLITVLSSDEHARFSAFWVFELSVGLYFPSMALLKSRIVAEANRGWTYGLMRLPLNVFVMSVLCTTGEGITKFDAWQSPPLNHLR